MDAEKCAAAGQCGALGQCVAIISHKAAGHCQDAWKYVARGQSDALCNGHKTLGTKKISHQIQSFREIHHFKTTFRTSVCDFSCMKLNKL